MKILHVVSSVDKWCGGTSEVVPRLARAQKELGGHEVTIAAIGIPGLSKQAERAFAAGVIDRAIYKISGWPRALAYSSALTKDLVDLVAKHDIVHLHGLWMAPPWQAAREARKQGKPYVMMPHGFLEPERLKISKWKKRIVGALIERKNLEKASGLVATAQSEVEGFKAYGLDRPTHIMPIGLDLEPIDSGKRNDDLLTRIGCNLNKKHILYFSRITPIKGLDMLCEAWSKVYHKDWQLLIVGPDDRGYTEEMKRLYAKHVEDGSVVFHGPVFGQDKFDLLKSIDAFMLPTRNENWSIAVAEALGAGLPVVCTKGAPWSCIDEVGAGKWTDICIEGIAAGLEFVMNADDETRKVMGSNGRKWVEDNLQWPKIAADVIKFYESIIKDEEKKL